MAQATIYGTIDQAYESTKLSVGKDTTKTTKIGGTMNGGSAIGFKASEDLGNGMKAYFQQEIGLSTDQNDTSYENRNSFVGLSGGFCGLVSLINHAIDSGICHCAGNCRNCCECNEGY